MTEVTYGAGDASNLPPVQLPTLGNQTIPNVVIGRRATQDAASDFPDYSPARNAAGLPTGSEHGSAASEFPEWKPTAPPAPSPPELPLSVGDRFADAGSSLGSGIVKGLASIAATPGDVRELMGSGMDAVANFVARKIGAPEINPQVTEPRYNIQPSTAQVESAVKPYVPSAISPDFKPKTDIGNLLQTGGEFLPSAVAGPGGIAKKLGYQVALPAIASTTARKVFEGNPAEGAAGAGGALTGSIIGAILSGRGGATKVLRSQLPANLTKADVDAARSLMNEARSQGIALTWPEALSHVKNAPVGQDMQRMAESSPHSRATMQEFMADRPAQVRGAFQGNADRIANPTGQPSAIGPAAAETAEGAIGDVRKAINAQAEPFYKGSEGILLTPTEMAQVRAVPGYEEAAKAVRADPQLNRYVSHLPENSVGFLNEVKKQLDTASKNAASVLSQNPNMQRAAGLGEDAKAVKAAAVDKSNNVSNVASQRSGEYGTALSIESQLREKYLTPLMNGPLGKLAESKDTKSAINALFPANPLPNSQYEISQAVSALAARRPALAEQLVRAHAEMVFNEANKALQGGANQFAGAKFAVRIAGNEQQRANLKAAVEALPKGRARWAGFEKFLDVVEATGRRQAIGSKTEFNRLEHSMMSGSSLVGEAVKLGASPGKWFSAVSDKWSNWQLGHNLDEVARIITDPTSGKLFAKIASMPTRSAEANATAARITLQVLEGARRPSSQ
jgi:hypothetical protein